MGKNGKKTQAGTGGARSEPGLKIIECEAESPVDPTTLDRALHLLALWARCRGVKLPTDQLKGSRKGVTLDRSKNYSSRKVED